MAANGADFTLTFRGLCDAVDGEAQALGVRGLFADPPAFDAWAERWRHRLERDGGDAAARRALMNAANPAFIPRNHLVEEAIADAQDKGDFSSFESLLAVLAKPFEDRPEAARYAAPPRPDQIVRQTFCGT